MRLFKIVVLIAAAAAVGACHPKPKPAAQQAGSGVRLPADVSPQRYDITITPDAEHLTFKASEKIAVDVQGGVRTVRLNALNLGIDRAVLEDGTTAKVSMDAKAQTADLAFPKALKPGRRLLLIDYHGSINPFSAGLFHLDYTTDQGPKRMLVSQFESADFRRFAPSWDQPDRKAVFQLTVVAPAAQMVISNTPAATTQAMPNGLKKVVFQPTPKMSTYLVFLGMGDLERITRNVDGVEVGVVMRRGAADQGRYALDAGVQLLRYYNNYFGIRYPLKKLDLIAAPGAGGFGAMENWGAILFFENRLLVDPRLATEADRRTNFVYIAHEMAHQWFGDLVTMAWWDDLWLNESFASWMENKASGDLHPQWRQELIEVQSREEAMRLDSRAATHPVVQPAETLDEVNEIGDAITYQKGEAVIRMIEQFVGPDVFRQGVRDYLRAHAYGNATRGDLWAAVENVAKRRVPPMARDFTEQAGMPLVRVDPLPAQKGVQAILRQGRFGVDEASRTSRFWRIPVVARAASGGPLITQTMTPGPVIQSITSPSSSPLIVNYGQSGYFRTLYAQSLFDGLAKLFAALQPADQLGMIYDSWALGGGGYVPVADVLELIERLPATADPQVWQQTIGVLTDIDGLYDGLPQQLAFRQWARQRLDPLLGRTGWAARPGEGAGVPLLRQAVLGALSRFGDEQVIADARSRFEQFRADPSSLPADQRAAMLSIVGAHADGDAFDQLRDMADSARDPGEQRQYLVALAGAEDPRAADRAMQMALSPDVPTSIGPVMIATVARRHPELAWRFAQARQKEIEARSDPSQVLALIPGLLSTASDTRLAEDLHAFAQRAYEPGGRRDSDKVEAEVRYRAMVRSSRLPELDRWLQLSQARAEPVAPAPETRPRRPRRP